MLRLHNPIRWWEPMLPAGLWLYAASLALELARALMRSRFYCGAAFP